MQKLGEWIAKALGLVVLAFILVIGLKSCVVTVWVSPDEPVVYGIHGSDGRSLRLVTFSNNRVLFHYTQVNPPSVEGALVWLRGTFGTHYFGPIWNVAEEGSLFGLRYYPGGVEPLDAELEVLARVPASEISGSFPPAGRTVRTRLLMAGDSVHFDGMWLVREDLDSSEMAVLEALRNDLEAASGEKDGLR